VKGFNTGSIGVVYVGGLGAQGKAKDTRTDAQKAAMERLCRELGAAYPIARFRGHRDASPDRNGDGKITSNEWLKECPCFDVVSWLQSVGIDPR
jgi:N-acetyl-anhydromuramyl-L-alanine amidase AmpD